MAAATFMLHDVETETLASRNGDTGSVTDRRSDLRLPSRLGVSTTQLHVRVELYVVIIIVCVLVAIAMPRGKQTYVYDDHRQALRATAAKIESSLSTSRQINYGDNLAKDSFRWHYRKLARELDKWDRSVNEAEARRNALAARVEKELAQQGITAPLLSHEMLPPLLADIAVRRVRMLWNNLPSNFEWSITDGGRLKMGGEGGMEVDLAEIEKAGISNERYQQIYEDTFHSLQTWPEPLRQTRDPMGRGNCAWVHISGPTCTFSDWRIAAWD